MWRLDVQNAPDKDIVHFTKEGKLVYYEGNFDAFRREKLWGMGAELPSGCEPRAKTKLDAEGAKSARARANQSVISVAGL